NFNEIGRVSSKGNSTNPQPYVFEDLNYANGQNYYRLKQVDLDGASSYSAIVSVDVLTQQTLKLYPNPVKDLLHVEGLNPDVTTTLSIVNSAGKVLYQFTTTGRSYNYNLQHLPAGTYYLRIAGSDKKTTTLKFIK
ncbi:MAG: T9SS type A sorting domain-containing protein, partial [Panacibacter sp.]